VLATRIDSLETEIRAEFQEVKAMIRFS